MESPYDKNYYIPKNYPLVNVLILNLLISPFVLPDFRIYLLQPLGHYKAITYQAYYLTFFSDLKWQN